MAKTKPKQPVKGSDAGSMKPLTSNTVKERKSIGVKIGKKGKTSANSRANTKHKKAGKASDDEDDEGVKDEESAEESEELDYTDAESAKKVKKLLLKSGLNSAMTPVKAPKPTVPNNGRHVGRLLIRWSPYMDQLLLLTLSYECSKQGIALPWASIAHRFASEKGPTGKCIIQHLSKLRLEMLNRGSWVPPLAGRSKASMNDKTDVRGVIRIGTDINNNPVYRDIDWDEDTSKLVNPTDLDQRMNGIAIDKNIVSASAKLTPGSAKRCIGRDSSRSPEKYKTPVKRGRKDDTLKEDEEVDLAEMVSDDDYTPGRTTKPKKRANLSRAAKKMAKHDFDEVEDEDEDEDMSDFSEKSLDIPMMFFNDEEKQASMATLKKDKNRKIVTLPAGKQNLLRFLEETTESALVVNGACDDDQKTPAAASDMLSSNDIKTGGVDSFNDYYQDFGMMDNLEQNFGVDELNEHEEVATQGNAAGDDGDAVLQPSEIDIENARVALSSYSDAVLYGAKLNLKDYYGQSMDAWNQYFLSNPCESLTEVARQLQENVLDLNGVRYLADPAPAKIDDSSSLNASNEEPADDSEFSGTANMDAAPMDLSRMGGFEILVNDPQYLGDIPSDLGAMENAEGGDFDPSEWLV